MTNKVWYWEYQLKIWDDVDDKEEMRYGIVAADTITEAMKKIEDYYGDEIEEVQTLIAIIDGVFEFQEVMENTDFDFAINSYQ